MRCVCVFVNENQQISFAHKQIEPKIKPFVPIEPPYLPIRDALRLAVHRARAGFPCPGQSRCTFDQYMHSGNWKSRYQEPAKLRAPQCIPVISTQSISVLSSNQHQISIQSSSNQHSSHAVCLSYHSKLRLPLSTVLCSVIHPESCGAAEP